MGSRRYWLTQPGSVVLLAAAVAVVAALFVAATVPTALVVGLVASELRSGLVHPTYQWPFERYRSSFSSRSRVQLWCTTHGSSGGVRGPQ